MQRPSATTPTQNATPFFSTNIWGNTISNSNPLPNSQSQSSSRSRPGTSSGDRDKDKEREHNVLIKDRDRKPSFGRRPSFSSPSKGKRRASSSNAGSGSGDQIKTDATAPPAIPPDFALAAAAKFSRESEAVPSPASADSFSKMLSRTATTPINGQYPTTATSPPLLQTEIPSLHQHIHEVSNKRISTLDYLRKAYVIYSAVLVHDGRCIFYVKTNVVHQSRGSSVLV